MHKRLVPLLATAILLPAAVIGVGCGGSDDSKSNDSAAPPTSAPSQAKGVPTNAGELKDRCVKEAQKITGQTKEQAEKTCTVPSKAKVDKAVKAALKGCLATAKELPAGTVRDKAVQECRDSVR